MKVAVSCDAIISRNYVIGVVESVLAIYEDAEIYCIVHKAGGVLGPIEQRKIKSTYLSNVIDDDYAMGESWWKKSFLIPGACKNLTIPCNVDLLINISSGFSHGIAKCEGVYQITYLVENSFERRIKTSLREKLFSGYVENWASKRVANCDELWVTNEKARDFWAEKHNKVSIMTPFFKASDFPLFPSAIRKTFPNDFLCFDSSSFNETEAVEIVEYCVENKIKFKFVGRDDHLVERLPEKYKENFFGERCSGELAPLLAACRGFVSLQRDGFPSAAISALSTGTPIALLKNSEGQKYFESGAGVFFFQDVADLKKELPSIFADMNSFDPKDLHNQTNKFHDLKFRGEFLRRMKDISETVTHKSSTRSC